MNVTKNEIPISNVEHVFLCTGELGYAGPLYDGLESVISEFTCIYLLGPYFASLGYRSNLFTKVPPDGRYTWPIQVFVWINAEACTSLSRFQGNFPHPSPQSCLCCSLSTIANVIPLLGGFLPCSPYSPREGTIGANMMKHGFDDERSS